MAMHAQHPEWPSPGRDLEPARAAFPARLIIDPAAIAHNARALARLCPATPLAVVKADAYGHGLEVAARAILDAGYRAFGVAQAEEACRLRRLLNTWGVDARVLSWIYWPGQVEALVAADIEITCSSVEQVLDVAAAARRRDRVATIHLKVDTGMSRAGASPADFPTLAAAAAQAGEGGTVRVAGLWSHLARADDTSEAGRAATRQQGEEFAAAVEACRRVGLDGLETHLAATAGALWQKHVTGQTVRWGISLYGLLPDDSLTEPCELRPAMRLEALLTLVKRVEAGRHVSYGGTATLAEDRWIGIVPVGYANGIPRLASNRAWVRVNGRRCPQLGRVCMDQIVVDLGPAEAAPAGAPGDLVAVMGGDGPDAAAWARWAETIPYEILTSAGQHVPRRIAAPGTGFGEENHANE